MYASETLRDGGEMLKNKKQEDMIASLGFSGLHLKVYFVIFVDLQEETATLTGDIFGFHTHSLKPLILPPLSMPVNYGGLRANLDISLSFFVGLFEGS